MDLYINPDTKYAKYNDLDVKIDQESYDVLRANGIDEMLARHIAHLFIRDALVSYNDYASYSDTETSEHFEVGSCSFFKRRIFSRPTGRVCDGNLQLLEVLWKPGEWNCVLWR